MYPGLPSRLEKEMKQLYLDRVLKGNTELFQVRLLRLVNSRLLTLPCLRSFWVHVVASAITIGRSGATAFHWRRTCYVRKRRK